MNEEQIESIVNHELALEDSHPRLKAHTNHGIIFPAYLNNFLGHFPKLLT